MNSYKIHKAIALFGVPRSGTSWLGQIFNSSPQVAYRYQPLFSYEFKSRLKPGSPKKDIDNFHEDLLEAKSDFVLQKTNISGNDTQNFKKSAIDTLVWKEVRYHNVVENLLSKDSGLKIVVIVRNPKSVISSWYHAPKEFDKSKWNIENEWRNAERKNQGNPEEFNGYDKWKETTELYVKLKRKYSDRFYIIRYSDLLDDTYEEVKKLFGFCDIKYTKQTNDFIERSGSTDLSKDAYSVYRKNQTNDKWKNDLPSEIAKEIDNDLRGTELEQFNR